MNQSSSTRLWIRVLLFLVGTLSRHKPTRALVARVERAIESLDQASAAVELAFRGVVIARAAASAADQDLVERITDFEIELLRFIGRDRTDAAYLTLFPDGLGGVTRVPQTARPTVARRIEEAIERDIPTSQAGIEALPLIRVAREELERQQEALRIAKDGVRAARSFERSTRLEAWTAYRCSYGDLVKIFPHRPRKVRSFFPRTSASVTAEEPEEPDAQAPAVAPSTPAPPTT